MRRKFLFAVMALLTMATGKIWAQGGTTTNGSTAYVVLCEDNSLHFLCSSETLAEGGTLSENGPKINGVWKDGEVLTTGTSAPGWQANNSSVTSVVIDNSFASARPMSCCRWFMSLKECTSISGMENLNTFMWYGRRNRDRSRAGRCEDREGAGNPYGRCCDEAVQVRGKAAYGECAFRY